jgi:hypothetical protein
MGGGQSGCKGVCLCRTASAIVGYHRSFGVGVGYGSSVEVVRTRSDSEYGYVNLCVFLLAEFDG